MDLQSEHERWLVEKKFNQPVILTDYPAEIKAFYMRANDDGKTVAAMDVLVPGIGELGGRQPAGGAFGPMLQQQMRRVQHPRRPRVVVPRHPAALARRPTPVSGSGFERLVMFATGMTNIRDVIPFPRTPLNAEF